MVIDSSAVLAILFDEPEAADFLARIATAGPCRLSAASLVEIGIVLHRNGGTRRSQLFDEILKTFSIRVEPVPESQARLAVEAYHRFGKGTGHAAGLNFGDCFSYALAKEVSEPLLFKGNDFIHTDIETAQ